MKIAPNYLKRYKEIARLFWKYGRSDLVAQMDLDAAEFKSSSTGAAATPDQLADDLETMGPAYVKLGQVLSSRPDLLPEPYVAALARLQDKVKPFSYGEVEEIVCQELGLRISKAFSRFDPKPIAAASLGQVHSAALRDGRQVVVKVQRPNIEKQIAEDFEVLAEIARFLDAHTQFGRRYRFPAILEELRESIQQELNYEREAQNLIRLGENLKEFDLIRVPQPVTDYCTPRVLTMDYVHGSKITALGPLVRMELNGALLAEQLFKAYLKQVLVDGLFHADPHPGNVFLTEDGNLALLDLGMVGCTTPSMQQNLLKILTALSDGDGEQVAGIVVRISEAQEGFNEGEFEKRLGRLLAARRDQGLQQLKVGRSLMEVTRNAAETGLVVPSELTLLGKTLLQLDEVGRILDPEFEPNEAIRRSLGDLMSRRMRRQATQGSVLGSILEMKDFVGGLPSRLNRIMDAVARQELELKVKSVDARMVVDGIQKIANRITAGILLAALILGAAQLMQVQTSFRLFGYPGFAMLFFLAAAAGGFWLLISIFVQDRKTQKKPPR